MDFLAWHNILFLSSLGVGVLIVIGAALGAVDTGELDVDVEAEAGLDAEIDLGAGGAGKGLLSILDIGQIPFTVLLMVATVTFGLVGVAASLTLAGAFGRDWPGLGVIALVLAIVAMVVLTGRLARLLIEHLPASETHVSTAADLVGAEATMFTKVFADVKAGTDVHRIECRSDSELAPGMRVTVIDYDPETRTYNVSPLPE
jgi:hypothetical protein